MASYSAISKSCEKSLHWEEAVHLAPWMRHGELTPDVVSYSTDAIACEKNKPCKEKAFA